MKKNALYATSVLSTLILLTGCASYKASSLSSLSSEAIMYSSNTTDKDEPVVIAKAFNKADCKKYLDRDVIKEGYQPIQLYIQNSSDKSYSFSLSRISLACARPEEVAEKVHTSTVGRAAGYGAAAVFSCGLLAIPAVIDGVKSSQANESLDNDFSLKTASDTIIYPYCNMNKLIFVNRDEYQPSFNVTLIDTESKKPKTFHVTAG